MGDFKHRIYGLLTATVLALGAGTVAHAQANYPVKPIRLIVPLAPGGEVVAGSPKEAIQFIEDQVAEYKDIIKKANIQVQ